jgi:sarcosine oxidase
MAARVHDVIVVGLGAMGSASLRALSRAGVNVLGIDRFAPPHSYGSTFGETRATRLGVGEGDVYVPLVQRSHAVWRELEAQSGETLLEACGFLTIDTSGGAAELHGMGGFFDRTLAVARRHDITHEYLDGRAIRERFPAFAAPDDARGYYEPEGGFVHVERAVSGLLADARAAGANIQTGETVIGYGETNTGVSVQTDRATYHAHSVVLTAGPWLPHLAPGPLESVRLYPQQLHWVAPDDVAPFGSALCPVYLWLHGNGAEDLFYGFPQVGSNHEVKVATEQYAREEKSADPPAEADEKARDAMIARHLAGRFARPVRPLRSVGCRYAVAPDGHFIIGRLPDKQRIIVVSACSGHGFKHAPAIGELVADMICDDAVPPPQFAIDRAALKSK